MSRTHNIAVQCLPTISTSRTASRTPGVSGQIVLDILTLESDVFQRCLSAQPVSTALQRFSRCKCAHLLRDLAAAADLPLTVSALFSQQLLDLTHRWWSEVEDPDIDVNDTYFLAAAACTCIKLHSARYPDLAPFQLPDPREPARPHRPSHDSRCYFSTCVSLSPRSC